jgi:hypothetical protein
MMQSKIQSFIGIALGLISGIFFISSPLNWEVSATTEAGDEGSQREPAELISTIRGLLTQTIIEYNNQNYTGAADLADVAYIDNFEFLEAPLAEEDEPLMEETEIILREDLSGLIGERASSAQVQELMNDINQRLDQAEDLLVTN